MPKRKGALSEHERRFVEAFLGPARGNATRAAILAGYSAKTARPQASRLLTRINVQRALVARQERRVTTEIADAAERDRIVSQILRDRHSRESDRLRAAGELNRCEGRYSITHVLKGKLTLEQAITAATKGEKK